MKKRSDPFKFTQEQITWLKLNAALPRKERAAQFNARFELDYPDEAINNLCKRRGIKTGRTGRFEKGHIPDPSGQMKPGQTNRGSFKKGNTPKNHVPVGTEVINEDGYLKVKTAEPNTWVFRHRQLWEEHHGPLQRGDMVRFRDGDKQNLCVANLVKISRAEHIMMTRRGYDQLPAELKPVALTACRLETAIFKRSRELKA